MSNISGHGNQFRAGQKAPNNGMYVEIGETGSMVNDPQQVKLEAGDKFPENTNQNRIWVNKRNLSKPSVQG